MKIEKIDPGSMFYGVGVLRGVLGRPELAHIQAAPVEQAIEHIQGAARLVDRLQRQLWKERLAKRKRRPRRKTKVSRASSR